MISIVYTAINDFKIGFLSEEVDQIIEIKKELIERKSLENIRMPHIAYKEKWYPLFDLQKIFCLSPSSPVRYAMMTKSSSHDILCGICTPHPFEEVNVSEECIHPFPAFLLQKQQVCLLYGYIQTPQLNLFLCSLSDIWHPIVIARYLLTKTPAISSRR
ncbi:MAG: hypothetical protein N2314_03150 [Brevinematales bacterium]|nr:hypothetical protein [Brevinematales bacterium]